MFSLNSNVDKMFDNNLYNIMAQMVVESKSLWRIKNEYMKDALEDQESQALWVELEKQKETNLRKLETLLRERLSPNKVSEDRVNRFEP